MSVTVNNPVINTVSVTAPSTGATVHGTTTVTTSAYSSVGISNVKLYVDGVLQATSTTSPYSFSWDTTKYADGSHILYVVLTDSLGDSTTSATTTLSVINSATDTVAITSPLSGSSVIGTTYVYVGASSSVGISNISLYVDGVYFGATGASTYAFPWYTMQYANGVHSLRAMIYDTQGTSTSTTITATVNNPAIDAITIASPVTGSIVSGTMYVYVAASSNVGISNISLYIDGVYFGATRASVYAFPLYTVQYANGVHTLRATMYNVLGAPTTTTVTVTVRNNIKPMVPASYPLSSSTIITPAITVATSSAGIYRMSMISSESFASPTAAPPQPSTGIQCCKASVPNSVNVTLSLETS
jgi:hypothetical protein